MQLGHMHLDHLQSLKEMGNREFVEVWEGCCGSYCETRSKFGHEILWLSFMASK
ncbi:hypothetical protein RDABS01_035501 [Bienertia sinuspersici]